MRHVFLNLKRFDISKENGGVNGLAPIKEWAEYIIKHTQDTLMAYEGREIEFAMFFPEAHLISADKARKKESNIEIGCQGVYRNDTSIGGNFGAFTTNLTANAARELGCSYTLIGHYEERKDKLEVMKEARGEAIGAVNHLLNLEIQAAIHAGLKVLYCIGENELEQEHFQEVLKAQIENGLKDVDRSKVVIAYEPVWAIGPGKIPPQEDYIIKISTYIKEITGGMDVVYGGGLKEDNAKMLAGIESIDGGLIALTRFQGEIGFYPEEYLRIIELYCDK